MMRIPALFLLIMHTICGMMTLKYRFVAAIVASPFMFRYTQPDGTQTAELLLRGDESLSFLRDNNGYTVVMDGDGWYVYATEDISTGELRPTALIVGQVDPTTVPELKQGLKPPRSHRNRFLEQKSQQRRAQSGTPVRAIAEAAAAYKNGSLKHLVILMKFSDHKKRTLPPVGSYDILFNQEGGDPLIAPTGSVRDMYIESSYGKLTIDSTVVSWITLPKPEAYYADNVSGLSNTLYEALNSALSAAEKTGLSFRDFDVDDDGIIDSLTFIHSGAGAEWGGEDCSGAIADNRIWSHQRADAAKWCGKENVCMDRYQIATGLWGRCSSEIGHIGVVGHELGHFLGLLDMYDTDGGGKGIGAYGLMGNCWGFDGTQLHPPPLDAWSKVLLGWVQPTILSSSGSYSIRAIIDEPEVFMITEGFPPGEYLMIENRQPLGFDSILPQGGLIIWHVDEKASYNTGGFPSQSGWPGNGNHYKVALLQADGLYSLDEGTGYGDDGDVWQSARNNYLGPSTSTKTGPFPNTDSYQNGVLYQTGIEIRDISSAGETMTFKLVLPESASPIRVPTRSPLTAQPTRSPQTLSPTRSPQTPSPSRSPHTAPPTEAPITLLLSKPPTSRPTKSPSLKPKNKSSSFPTNAPSVTPSSFPTSAPSVTPTSSSTSAPTRFDLPTRDTHKDLQNPVSAVLPVFRIEAIFAPKSSEDRIDTNILLNHTAGFIDGVFTRHYASAFGRCTVSVEVIASSSAASVPTSQARMAGTRRRELSESTTIVEIKPTVTFYNGTVPQIEEMTNLLTALLNDGRTAKDEDTYSFMAYLRNAGNPVLASVKDVTAVVVIHPAITQNNESFSGGKYSSSAWLFVVVGLSIPIIMTIVYYAVWLSRGESPESDSSSQEFATSAMHGREMNREKISAISPGTETVPYPPRYETVENMVVDVFQSEDSQDISCSGPFVDCGSPSWLVNLFNFKDTEEQEEPEFNFENYVLPTNHGTVDFR